MTARKPERDRDIIALEKIVPALLSLDKERYSSYAGRYRGGRKAVRRVLAYLNERFPA